jgi:chemotaxis protein methyltransferase CheR
MNRGEDGDAGAAAAVLSSLLEARTGQQLAPARAWRIDTALGPLLTAAGARDAEDLVSRLVGAGDPGLADRIVDALLNQETSFFRDAGVIEAAAAAIMAVAAEDASGPRRLRIWSAGCATGQEPLSLAMHFAEVGGVAPDIVATDVSEGALTRARAGRFSQFEIQRGLPVRRMMRWFDSVGGDWIAKPELMRMVAFRRHNLVADAPPVGRFDAIFCRNVLFYLSPARRSAVFDRLAAALRPDGLLVLGAGETVIGLSDQFRPSPRFRGFYEIALSTPMAVRSGLG